MSLNPAIIALLLASAVGLLMFTWSSLFGWQVVRSWDIRSGSELQLSLERRTYLISTLLSFVFATQLIGLLLFIFNAEKMSTLFVGAMCAVGTLNVNPFGWPSLILKIVIFFLASSWLILNYVDTRGYDYPLTRIKYRLLLAIAPLVMLESFFQLRYFLNLDADVITSCCGSLFSGEQQSLAAELSSFPPLMAMIGLYVVMAITVISGMVFYFKGRGGYLFPGLGVLAFVVAIAGIVSFISLYVYEHPHHHCPFCLLQPEYNYQGYVLYLPLFAATACALGVGILRPFRTVPSLNTVIAAVSQRLSLIATGLFFFFLVWVSWIVINSNLILIDTYTSRVHNLNITWLLVWL